MSSEIKKVVSPHKQLLELLEKKTRNEKAGKRWHELFEAHREFGLHIDRLKQELERVETKLLQRIAEIGNTALPTRRIPILFLQDNKSFVLKLFARLNRC